MSTINGRANFSLHWTGSSRFSLLQFGRRWRLLPASELIVSRMRRAVSILLLVLVGGCATPERTPYVYSPPVVVTINKVRQEYDHWVAICTVTNTSKHALWFDGEGRENPVYSVETDRHPYRESEPQVGVFWGDIGVGRYILLPGQSSTFLVRESRFDEPFRVGLWLSPEEDNRTFNEQVYWSETFTP